MTGAVDAADDSGRARRPACDDRRRMADAPNPTLILLQRLHAGDQAALHDLVTRHIDWLRRHVHGRLGAQFRGRMDTHDVVQDVLVDVLEDGPRFRITDEDDLHRILLRIVENTICDRNRYLRRDMRDVARERPMVADTVLDLDPPERTVTRPSQHADAHEREAWVRLALEFLDPDDRQAIWLREFEEKSFREVGEQLGVSEEAARKRFTRALPLLAQRVAELRDGRLRQLLDHGPEAADAPPPRPAD